MVSRMNQAQADNERKSWMSGIKRTLQNARSNFRSASGMEEEELEPILGSSVTVLFDRVQQNPQTPTVKVDLQGYAKVQTNDKGTWTFPVAYGNAAIMGDGRGNLNAKTPVFVLPYRSEAPRNRQESADQRSARHAVNDYVVSVFAEEGLMETAEVIQARQIIPAIHHHEDGSTKACVYILADNIFTGYRGRLETSRSHFMQPSEDLPEVEEEQPKDEMEDELVTSLLG